MKLKALFAACALAVMGSAGHAVTINDGDVACEGSNLRPGLSCSQTIAEIGQDPGDLTIDIAASVQSAFIEGAVRGDGTLGFADRATITGSGAYIFTVKIFTPLFDGTSFDADLALDGVVGTLSVGAGVPDVLELTKTVNLAGGPVIFDLNAETGISNGSAAYYQVAIAAVPLPASVLLLLAGLSGLGVVARRRA